VGRGHAPATYQGYWFDFAAGDAAGALALAAALPELRLD